MDIDETDLLTTNTFLSTPDLSEVHDEKNEMYRLYTLNKKELENESNTVDIVKKFQTNLEFDESIPSGNVGVRQNTNQSSSSDQHRYYKTSETLVHIDSRDREHVAFPTASSFQIKLPRKFTNVKSVALSTIEFPNTNAVINSTNNRIYWRNQEDIDLNIIDPHTLTYPVYSITMRIGSYTSGKLQIEMTNDLNLVKRQRGISGFHYFIVNLDINTDIVTFTSLILTQCGNNCLSTSLGSGVINLRLANHGYKTGQNIYIVGARQVAGVLANVLNSNFNIQVIDANNFQFTVNVDASDSIQLGGGNTIQSGVLAPFQLLWGQHSYTVAQNIGYPLENSSQRVDTAISGISNANVSTIYSITQADSTNIFIKTIQKHFLSVNDLVTLTSTNSSPSVDNTYSVAFVIDDYTIELYFNTLLAFVGTSGVLSYSKAQVGRIYIQTPVDNNFTINDIGSTITVYNSNSIPNIDGTHTIIDVYQNTNNILDSGNNHIITVDGNVLTTGTSGTMPRNNPLSTTFYTVIFAQNVQISSTVFVLRLTLNTAHLLHVGNSIQVNTIQTTPNFYQTVPGGIITVYAVPASNQIDINFHASSVDLVSIESGSVFVGTGLITVSFPNHGFNAIVNIQTGATTGTILFTTLLNHGFVNNLNPAKNPYVTLSQTQGFYNSIPLPYISYRNLDGYYQINVINNTQFTINFVDPLDHIGSPKVGTYLGIFGLSDNIFIYSSDAINGLLATDINNNSFAIQDIIDSNIFVVMSLNAYCSNTAKITGGGSNIFISSEKNGFQGVQTNTKNNLLNRSINLEGENYVFLCCPTLSLIMNSGIVQNIFTKITLQEGTGAVLFNSGLDVSIIFENGLPELQTLLFEVITHDNLYYEFNNLDYSFCLNITEFVDNLTDTGFSSRRGVTDPKQFQGNTGYMKPI